MLTVEKVLAAAFRDVSLASALSEVLSSDLAIANPFHLQLGNFLTGFVSDHRKVPKAGDLGLWIDSLPEAQAAGVRQSWSEIQAQDISQYTPEYLLEHAFTELKNVAAKTALSRLLQVKDQVSPEVLLEYAERVSQMEPVALTGLADIADVKRWSRVPPALDVLDTGIPKLNGFLGGGWRRKELVFIMADSGVGKTAALCNHATAAMKMGANVFQISMELSTENLMHRHYRRIAEVSRSQFERKRVESSVMHWLRYAKGQVHALFVPAFTLTPEKLAVMLQRFEDVTKEKMDVLVLDYLDLMAPAAGSERLSEYQQLGRVAHMVRNMADAHDCLVLSATQTIRGAQSERPRLSDMGDSYGKVRAADIIIALSQTEEEKEKHQGRYTVLKVRESQGRGRSVLLYLNMDLMLVGDADHDINIRRIMDRLGHLHLEEDKDADD